MVCRLPQGVLALGNVTGQALKDPGQPPELII
jgi:hypothetical protein